MAVLIKGMEMPKHDDEYVIFTVYGDGGVVYGPLNRPHVRYKNRAVPVPQHGDLIDRREAIIDANERAYDFWLSDDEVNATIQFLKEQPTIIPAADVRPVEWIPVTERLPQEWWPVLGLIQYHDEKEPPSQQVLWYLGNGHWRETWRGDMIESDVTHWMPLPEPPKEEQT